jgi:hypothetical protein
VQSGHRAVAWVERTRSVIRVAALSSVHASSCNAVASGSKCLS